MKSQREEICICVIGDKVSHVYVSQELACRLNKMKLLLIALLSAVYLFIVGQSLTIQSQFPTVQYINGQLQQINTITIAMSETDVGITRLLNVTGPNGTVQVSITTEAPLYVYAKVLNGYVYRDGKLYVKEVCKVYDIYSYNATEKQILERGPIPVSVNSVAASSALRPNKRRTAENEMIRRRKELVQKLGLSNNGFMEIAKETNEQTAIDFVRAQVGFYNTPKVFGCMLVMLSCANEGVDWDSFNALKGSLAAESAKWSNFADAFTSQLTAQNATIHAIGDSLRSVNESLAAGQEAIAATLAVTAATANSSSALYTAISQNVNLLYDLQADTSRQLLSLSSRFSTGSLGSNSNITIAIQTLQNFTTNINNMLNVTYQALQTMAARNEPRFRILERLANTQNAVMIDYASRHSDRRALSQSMQLALNDIINDGFTPFLKDLGTQAPTYLGSNQYFLLDSIRFMFNKSDSSLVQEDYAVYCDTAWMVNINRISWVTWRDVYEMVGPATGCVTGSDAAANGTYGTCQCWIEKSRKECDPLNGGSSARFYASAVMNATDVCLGGSGGVVVLPVLIFHNPILVVQDLGSKCSYTSPSTQFKTVSDITASTVLIPYSSYQCNPVDLVNSFDPTAPTLNIVYGFWYYLSLSYNIAKPQFQVYEAYLDGELADGVTTWDVPFDKIENKTASCTQVAAMGYGPELLPVYTFSPVSVTAQITVSYSGTTTVYTQPSLSTPLDFVLPARYVIVGEPTASTIFDIAQSDLSLASTPGTRENQALYGLCDYNSTALCTYRTWQSKYGVRFNQFAGANVPQLYAQNVDPLTGQCTGVPIPGSGSWCTVLENFLAFPTANGVILSPFDFTSTFTAAIPTGSVSQIIFSQCPLISVEPSSGSTVTVVMTNQGPVDMVVNVKLQCGSTVTITPDYTIAANNGSRLLIKACLTRSQNLTVSYYNTTGLVPCPAGDNIDVSVNRTYVLLVEGNADTRYVQSETVNRQDGMTFALTALQLQMASYIVNTTIPTMAFIQGSGYDLSSPAFDTLVSSATSFFPLLTQQINDTLNANINRNVSDPADLAKQYQSQLNSLFTTAYSKLDLLGLANLATSNSVNVSQAAIIAESAAIVRTITALNEYTAQKNATNLALIAAMYSIYSAVDDLSSGGLGIDFGLGPIGPFLGHAVGDGAGFITNTCVPGMISAVDFLAKQAVNAYNDAKGFANGLFDSITGFFNKILEVFIILLFIVVPIGAIYYIYRYTQKGKQETAEEHGDFTLENLNKTEAKAANAHKEVNAAKKSITKLSEKMKELEKKMKGEINHLKKKLRKLEKHQSVEMQSSGGHHHHHHHQGHNSEEKEELLQDRDPDIDISD